MIPKPEIPFYKKDSRTFQIYESSYMCILEFQTEDQLVNLYDQLEHEASEFFGLSMEIHEMFIAVSPHGDTVDLIYFKPIAPHSNLIM